MKKISAALFLTAALSLGVSAYAQTNPTGQVDNPAGQAAPQKPVELRDVPAGHWASAAIQVAANCGIVRGFPDGTFRGNEPITRYQAAVIIARLLEAIKNGECGVGTGTGQLSSADVTTLQNAIQELSADLAQLGVRVAELEDNAVTQDDLARVEEIATNARDLAEQAAAAAGTGTPATGDFATQDDLARVEEIANQARDLAEALANGQTTTGEAPAVSPDAITELTDQVEAASIAADTALAQARELQDKVDELSGRVDDLEGQLGELGATVEGQADSIAALNDLVVLLNQDVLSLQDRVTALEQGVGETSQALADAQATFATQDDLESLREFTTLLRRDQTALADRVGELETRVGAVENRVTAVETRVTTLENNGFTVSGTLSLNYDRRLTWDGAGGGLGSNFDVDRLFFGSPFSTGAVRDSVNDSDTPRDYGDFGIDSADSLRGTPGLAAITVDANNKTPAGTGVRYEGRFDPGISLNFTFKPRALIGGTTNGIGNNFTVALTLALNTSAPYGTASDGSDNVNPVGLTLTSLATQYTVGGAPLLINFGIDPAFKFTEYGFNNAGSNNGRGDGFVATLDGSGLLPLNLGLTIAYGSTGGVNGDNRYYTGIRGTASLIPGFTGGIYYGVEAADVVTNPQATINLYGLNFGGALGPISLNGEYNVSQADGSAAQVAGFVRGSADLGFFTVAANYRVVDVAYTTTRGISVNSGPYAANQVGFGTDIALKLGFATVNFYYDQRGTKDASTQLGNGPKSDTQAGVIVTNEVDFGVNLTIRLIGFDIAPYVTRQNETDAGGVAQYDRTTYGVNLTHDGSKPDALIGGFNLALGYRGDTNGLNNDGRTILYAYADTSISLLGFTIAPKAYFSQVSTTGTTFTPPSGSAAGDDVTNYGGSLSISGGFLFGSTLSLAAALDQSSHSNNGAGAFTSSTGWISASLAFNPSIFGTPSTFKVAFASRTDANRNGKGSGPTLASPVGDDSWAGANAADTFGVSTNLSGLYFQFSYYGLNFDYGIFALTDFRFANNAIGGVTFGQAFRIAYALKF
jgi:polyhydroxyalkanoate synthesis regulator phasin